MKIAVGLGCDRGTSLDTLLTALLRALEMSGCNRFNISTFASIDAKSDEEDMLQLAELLEKPIVFFSAEELAAVPVPNPSEVVRKYMGTPAVSEAAALLAAGAKAEALLLEKYKYLGKDSRNATVSIARMKE